MMRNWYRVLLFSGAIVAAPAIAAAQDHGNAGVTMGYPSSIGILWQATDHLAIRPEFSASRTTADTTATVPVGSSMSTSDTWSAGLGVSALFQLGHWDAVRAYVGPRFLFSHVQGTSDIPTLSTLSETSTTSIKSSGSVFSTGGLVGAQFRAAKHFGVFGETGVTYSHSTSTSFSSKVTTKGVGSTSGAGVIVYF